MSMLASSYCFEMQAMYHCKVSGQADAINQTHCLSSFLVLCLNRAIAVLSFKLICFFLTLLFFTFPISSSLSPGCCWSVNQQGCIPVAAGSDLFKQNTAKHPVPMGLFLAHIVVSCENTCVY